MLESRLAAGAVSSHSHGGAVLGAVLQPSSADAVAVALGDVAQGDDGVEVVRLVILDEVARAQGAVGVAGGAQEDDRVVVSGDGEGLGEPEHGGDAGGVVAGALRGQRRHVAVGEDHDGPLRASLGDRPDVLQRHVLAVDGGREAVDVRLEAHGAELLLDPDAHAVVRVGAGDALREVLDDGHEVGVGGVAVERRGLLAELGGVRTAEREQGDDDEDGRDDPGHSIHLQVGQGRPPRACPASYQMPRSRASPGARPAEERVS